MPNFHGKLLVQVPSGLGKSYLIPAIICASTTHFKNFHIVYSTEELQNAESGAIALLRKELQALNKTLTCSVASDAASVTALPNTLMIIDECDTIILDRLLNPKAAFVIGLTATPLLNMQGYEKILVSPLSNLLCRSQEGQGC